MNDTSIWEGHIGTVIEDEKEVCFCFCFFVDLLAPLTEVLQK